MSKEKKPKRDMTEAEGVIMNSEGKPLLELEYIQKGGSRAKQNDKSE